LCNFTNEKVKFNFNSILSLQKHFRQDSSSKFSYHPLNEDPSWKEERIKRRESTPTYSSGHLQLYNQSISKAKECDNHIKANSVSDETFKRDTKEVKKFHVFHPNDDTSQIISKQQPDSKLENFDSCNNKVDYDQTSESSDDKLFKKFRGQIESEILNLSVEECIKKMNEKMSIFIEKHYEAS